MEKRLGTAERAGLDPKERKRRAKIGNEKISIRIEGSEIYKFVKRIKLTLKDINKIFDCDAWYAKDEASGDVIWPEKWQTTMQASTEASHWRYIIVERDQFPRFDQTKDSSVYDGDAVIWCESVPYECEAATLVCWIRAGLEAVLPHIRKAAHREQELLKFFEQSNAELNDCMKQPAQDEEEEHYKSLRAESLKEAADVAEARFHRAKDLHADAVSLCLTPYLYLSIESYHWFFRLPRCAQSLSSLFLLFEIRPRPKHCGRLISVEPTEPTWSC